MKSFNTQKLVMTALSIAVGLLLPTFFHFFGGTGPVFLPMHIPVLLCGFICGGYYGLLCGFITPILSSVITGMPHLYPAGIVMVLELSTYGFVSGYLFQKRELNVYISLIAAMLCGRAVAGAANTVLLGMTQTPYSFTAFMSTSFITAFPGILIQIVFIPTIIMTLRKANLLALNTKS